MPAKARLGDPTSHGGFVITCSPDTYTNGFGNARIGDLVSCPIHGNNPIISGATHHSSNGKLDARIGDRSACGSIIISGSPDRYVGNDPAPAPLTIHWHQDSQIFTYNERDLGGLRDEPSNYLGHVLRNPKPQPLEEADRRKNDKLIGEKPPVVEEDPKEPPPKTPAPVGCENVEAEYAASGEAMQLSSSFKLSDVSTNTAISRNKVVAQRGLRKDEIICNLRALCVNTLEPLAAHVGGRSKMIITSGFRTQQNGRSQHEEGKACDVQFTDQGAGNKLSDMMWERAKWVRDNVMYDQFILEYLGNRPWFHLSYNRTGTNRRQVLSIFPGESYKAGLIRR